MTFSYLKAFKSITYLKLPSYLSIDNQKQKTNSQKLKNPKPKTQNSSLITHHSLLTARYLTSLFIITLLASCGKDRGCIQGEGPREKTNGTAFNIETISLEMAGDIRLTIDSTISQTYYSIQTEDNVREEIDVTGNRGTLTFKFAKCISQHKNVLIDVRTPYIRKLQIVGVGDIASVKALNIDTLDLEITGNGDMDLIVNCNQLATNIEGSSRIEIQGTAKHHNATINGGGSIQGLELISDSVSFTSFTTGSGQLLINKFLDADLQGNGGIILRGDAAFERTGGGEGKVEPWAGL